MKFILILIYCFTDIAYLKRHSKTFINHKNKSSVENSRKHINENYNVTKLYDSVSKFTHLRKSASLQFKGTKRHFLKHHHHHFRNLSDDVTEQPRRRHHHFPSYDKVIYNPSSDNQVGHIQSVSNDINCCNENVVTCCESVEPDNHYSNMIPVDTDEHLSPSGIHQDSTDFYNDPKHMYQHPIEKTEDGADNGGFLQNAPEHMHVPGMSVISRQPIHIKDAHSTTSYETSIEKGSVHEHVCLNGGLYFPINDKGYQCVCPESRIGKNCGDENHCHPNPCRHGAHCHNIKEDPYFTCGCNVGFYGNTCEQKDPCYPNPCKNHAECTHDGIVFSCICSEKFRGTKCEELNHCSPNPCGNGGTCIEQKGEGKFLCQCSSPWRGTICEDRSYCAINPCLNGGTCRETDTHFECECGNGFSGPTCNDRVCQPNPCLNGGTCVEDGDHYRCVCLPWTSGAMCEENRPCLTKPCLHDGKCIDGYAGFHWSFGPLQYYCVCKPPYKGMNCEKHACKNCHKNAHCVVDHCVCDEGYEGNGETCKKIENPCHPNPCLNGGSCTEASEYCTGTLCGFKCTCAKPYLPPTCKEKHPCDPDPCINGVCVANRDTFACHCEQGYRGKFCSDKDACNPNPCQHHGSCISSNSTATCTCAGEWLPPFCKDCGCPKSIFHGVPHMTCDVTGSCVCPNGYLADTKAGICRKDAGPLITPPIAPCASHPCTNGGTCTDVGVAEFKCACLVGFTGKVCHHKTACNPNPCINGGTCNEKNGFFLSCTCSPSYSPPFCINQLTTNIAASPEPPAPETPENICSKNPCKHEGICIPSHGSYDCVCAPRYTGPHCDVDRCANCHKDAKCVIGRCKCNTGFIGNGYNCERDTCEMLCVEWSTCIDGQCVCNPGYQKENGKCQPNTLRTLIQQVPEVLQPHYIYSDSPNRIQTDTGNDADRFASVDTTTDNPESPTTILSKLASQHKMETYIKNNLNLRLPTTRQTKTQLKLLFTKNNVATSNKHTVDRNLGPLVEFTLTPTQRELVNPTLYQSSTRTAPSDRGLTPYKFSHSSSTLAFPYLPSALESTSECPPGPPGIPCQMKKSQPQNNAPFDDDQALEDEADDLAADYASPPAHSPVARSSLFSSLNFKLPPTNPHPHEVD